MKTREDLLAQVCLMASSFFAARAGELVRDEDNPGKLRPYTVYDAVDEAALLVNAIATRTAGAFERAARETRSASLWTAVGD